MDWLSDPFTSPFTQRASLMCLLVGILAPLVGTWIVLRRLSYLGDAMSHATIGGVAIAFWVAGSSSVLIGALGAGIVMAILMAMLSLNRRLGQDAIIGVIESAMFATGIIVISRLDTGTELTHFLFGQLLTVTAGDVWLGATLTVAATIVIVLLFGDLRMSTFDEMHARQVGVRVGLVHFVLLLLLAVVIVVCLRTVGTLMSVAMLVVPAATARLLTSNVRTMTFVAIAIGVVAALTGFAISYHAGSSPGATIALTASGAFAGVYAITLPRRQRHHPRPAV
jgi:ABC-type Mn2+/Zn2+ transport system permease subunit